MVKKTDAEKPTGEWNTVEVVCDGDKITNIVNGVVVNEGTNASVTKGKILLQSEGAEVYYRKVELTAAEPTPNESSGVLISQGDRSPNTTALGRGVRGTELHCTRSRAADDRAAATTGRASEVLPATLRNAGSRSLDPDGSGQCTGSPTGIELSYRTNGSE